MTLFNGRKSSTSESQTGRSGNGCSSTFLIGIIICLLLGQGFIYENCQGSALLEQYKVSFKDLMTYAGYSQYTTAPGVAASQKGYNAEQQVAGVGGGQHHHHGDVLLPDWRQAIDCNAYDNACTATMRRLGRKYKTYPFPMGRKIKNDHLFDYQSLPTIPEEWKSNLLQEHNNILLDQPLKRPIQYVYPPQVPKEQFEKCVQDAITISWQEQIDTLLQSKRLQRESTTNMIAFTISDYNYAVDMMHDIFEMNDQIVGYPGAFFMVAIDKETVDMACAYGYPVVAWPSAKPQDTTELKHAVANTKFEVSLELVNKGIDFFFYEMDVWFIQSPKDVIAYYHHSADKQDMLVSSHQDCPMCLNIGAYSISANERTKEYFENCILMAKESPNTHDQFIMGQLLHASAAVRDGGQPMEFKSQRWTPLPQTNPAPIQHPLYFGYYHSHEIVANERPIATQHSYAIHTLTSGPLKKPHGKKMMAKELGGWYGFQGPHGDGGYYTRTGDYRRYLTMDGHMPGSYSIVMNFEFDSGESGLYNNMLSLGYTMATLLALARRTGRIFIMPRIVAHHGVHFLWQILDFETVEEIGIDYRETNYFNNPKSWYSSVEPFGSVARTALGSIQDSGREKTMYVQFPPAGNNATTTTTTSNSSDSEGPIQAWKFNDDVRESDALDAWWALHTALPEVDSAEILLVNPHIIQGSFAGRLDHKRRSQPDTRDDWSVAEREIIDVYGKLKWCKPGGDIVAAERIVGRVTADWDCHGKGSPYEP